MTDQEVRETTEQETTIYDELNSGNSMAVMIMQGETEDPEQFQIDYQNALARYQNEHEMPEEEREQATAEAVVEENTEAREVTVEVVPDTPTQEEA